MRIFIDLQLDHRNYFRKFELMFKHATHSCGISHMKHFFNTVSFKNCRIDLVCSYLIGRRNPFTHLQYLTIQLTLAGLPILLLFAWRYRELLYALQIGITRRRWLESARVSRCRAVQILSKGQYVRIHMCRENSLSYCAAVINSVRGFQYDFWWQF